MGEREFFQGDARGEGGGGFRRGETVTKSLKEFGSHVVGDDDARTRLVRPDDDDAAEEDETPTTSEPPPNAADAMRFAESFTAGAWSAFGGAANKAKQAFEKAEGVIEKAASDPKTFAKDVRGKAQTVGIGAFSALSSVVKARRTRWRRRTTTNERSKF